jgi:hypothetical protein
MVLGSTSNALFAIGNLVFAIILVLNGDEVLYVPFMFAAIAFTVSSIVNASHEKRKK